MTARIDIPRDAISAFCRQHHVRKLSLFGSVVRDDFSPESDIDVLVEFEPGKAPSIAAFLQMRAELSDLFGHRHVDLVTPSVLRNPYRKRTIVRDLEPIYGS
jgi:predicted nucleotidyltransferase